MGDTSRPPRILGLLAGSKPVEVVLTLAVYAVYAAVVAASLVPACYLLIRLLPPVLAPALASGSPTDALRAAALAAAALAGALYLYLFVGAVVQAAAIRFLSLGVRPGRYPAVSLTTLRWLVYNGIFTISMRTVLPLIPVSFLTNLYFRIVGCRMGRNVKLNAFQLNDAYLLAIGDNVIVGGQTDISCHLFEHDHLILRPITIGSGTLIGAHSYISPGVSIGSDCLIGLYSYIRAGRTIPDGAKITSLAGIDVHTARHIERGRVVGPRHDR
ncbi:MAG: DapH/DapD/GlmU-related protein [Spirochaetota bacterium]